MDEATMSGAAFRMRLELARLASQHKVVPKPCIIPLSASTDAPMTIEGLASTTDIDLDHMKFRRFAFCNPALLIKGFALPPLYYKHDETQPAGEIESLTYDNSGNLKIRVHVTHPLAKRCGAFSIRAKIIDYELRDVDSPNFHAFVTRGEIIEVSLTDRPANPHALVQCRYRAAPVAPLLKTTGEFTSLMIRRVEIAQQFVQLIQQTCDEHQRRSQYAAADHATRVTPRPAFVHRPKSEFKRLVEQLNNAHPC